MSYFQSEFITDPNTGRQVWVDEFYSSRANPIARLAGTPFVGTTKDPNFWAESNTGTGGVTQSGGQIVLNTGATTASTTQYQSVRMARWVTGNENTFRAMLKVGDTGTANNIRNWGAFTTTDGFFFQLNGTTVNIVSRAGSSDTPVAQASWNGPAAAAFVLDLNFHIYEIKMTYADVHFYIDHQLVHTLKPTTTLFSQTLTLNITLQNNSTNAANVTMTVGVAFISRTGLLQTESQYFHGTTAATTVLKYGAGRLHNITLNTIAANGSLISIYDNTAGSGTPVIGVFTAGGATTTSTLIFDVPFSTGLSITTTGTWDYTVSYE